MIEIDEAWRKFFSPEMQLSLCRVIAENYENYAQLCLQFNLAIEPDTIAANLADTKTGDLTTLFQNMNVRFESVLNGRNHSNFRGNIQDILLRFLPFCSNRVEPEEVAGLKAKIQSCKEFYNVCGILRNARNLNAHVLEPISEVGHALITASAVIRLVELCNTERFRDNIEQLRKHAEETLGLALPLLGFELLQTNSTIKDARVSKSHSQIEKVGGLNSNTPNSEAAHAENNAHDDELDDMPQQKALIAPYEEKRRRLLEIRVSALKNDELKSLGMGPRTCPISRQSIFEMLGLSVETFSQADICPSITFYAEENPVIFEKFADLYASDINQILAIK